MSEALRLVFQGEVLSTARGRADGVVPGSRAYLSASAWSPTGGCLAQRMPRKHADVEVDEVAKLYTKRRHWESALAVSRIET